MGAAVLLAAGSAYGVGIETGQKVPAFQADDQNGRSRAFEDLKGEEGLLLLFYRSADW